MLLIRMNHSVITYVLQRSQSPCVTRAVVVHLRPQLPRYRFHLLQRRAQALHHLRRDGIASILAIPAPHNNNGANVTPPTHQTAPQLAPTPSASPSLVCPAGSHSAGECAERSPLVWRERSRSLSSQS